MSTIICIQYNIIVAPKCQQQIHCVYTILTRPLNALKFRFNQSRTTATTCSMLAYSQAVLNRSRGILHNGGPVTMDTQQMYVLGTSTAGLASTNDWPNSCRTYPTTVMKGLAICNKLTDLSNKLLISFIKHIRLVEINASKYIRHKQANIQNKWRVDAPHKIKLLLHTVLDSVKSN